MKRRTTRRQRSRKARSWRIPIATYDPSGQYVISRRDYQRYGRRMSGYRRIDLHV